MSDCSMISIGSVIDTDSFSAQALWDPRDSELSDGDVQRRCCGKRPHTIPPPMRARLPLLVRRSPKVALAIIVDLESTLDSVFPCI